jgi:hypothetical protein
VLCAEPRRRFTEQLEAGGQLRQPVAALFGEHEAARESLEQRRVEIALESADLLAHGRGAHAQLRAGRDEAAEPRGGFEGAQCVERGQAAAHG